MKTEFLDVAYEKAYNVYMKDAVDYVDDTKLWTSIRNGCFLGVLLIAYIVIIMQFINQLKREIWHTRGLLNMMPTRYLLNNKNLKKKLL